MLAAACQGLRPWSGEMRRGCPSPPRHNPSRTWPVSAHWGFSRHRVSRGEKCPFLVSSRGGKQGMRGGHGAGGPREEDNAHKSPGRRRGRWDGLAEGICPRQEAFLSGSGVQCQAQVQEVPCPLPKAGVSGTVMSSVEGATCRSAAGSCWTHTLPGRHW